MADRDVWHHRTPAAERIQPIRRGLWLAALILGAVTAIVSLSLLVTGNGEVLWDFIWVMLFVGFVLATVFLTIFWFTLSKSEKREEGSGLRSILLGAWVGLILIVLVALIT